MRGSLLFLVSWTQVSKVMCRLHRIRNCQRIVGKTFAKHQRKHDVLLTWIKLKLKTNKDYFCSLPFCHFTVFVWDVSFLQILLAISSRPFQKNQDCKANLVVVIFAKGWTEMCQDKVQWVVSWLELLSFMRKDCSCTWHNSALQIGENLVLKDTRNNVALSQTCPCARETPGTFWQWDPRFPRGLLAKERKSRILGKSRFLSRESDSCARSPDMNLWRYDQDFLVNRIFALLLVKIKPFWWCFDCWTIHLLPIVVSLRATMISHCFGSDQTLAISCRTCSDPWMEIIWFECARRLGKAKFSAFVTGPTGCSHTLRLRTHALCKKELFVYTSPADPGSGSGSDLVSAYHRPPEAQTLARGLSTHLWYKVGGVYQILEFWSRACTTSLCTAKQKHTDRKQVRQVK